VLRNLKHDDEPVDDRLVYQARWICAAIQLDWLGSLMRQAEDLTQENKRVHVVDRQQTPPSAHPASQVADAMAAFHVDRSGGATATNQLIVATSRPKH
jgi:hypothetical protein